VYTAGRGCGHDGRREASMESWTVGDADGAGTASILATQYRASCNVFSVGIVQYEGIPLGEQS
jgi:hypothetical protein